MNYELDNFTFKKLYAESFYINITLKQMFNILTISSGKSTIFQIAFSIKKIVVFSFKFLVKLIWCIAFVQALVIYLNLLLSS